MDGDSHCNALAQDGYLRLAGRNNSRERSRLAIDDQLLWETASSANESQCVSKLTRAPVRFARHTMERVGRSSATFAAAQTLFPKRCCTADTLMRAHWYGQLRDAREAAAANTRRPTS